MHGFKRQGAWRQRPGRQGDINLATLLSLELLLLAFFILLTSHSEFEEERARQVIGGVQAAFADSMAALPGLGSAEPSDAVVLRAIQDDIGRVVKTAIPLARVERTTAADTMRIQLPADSFFPRGEARLNPVQHDFFAQLVGALERRRAGFRYDLDILQAGGLPQAQGIARAAAVVGALTAAGLPQESLSVSIGGDPGWISVVIRLQDGGRAANLFDGLRR